MDGNKDEAMKCLKIGKEAMESGDRARALKFVSKARRLDPSLPVDGLLANLDGQSGNDAVNGSSSSSSSMPSENGKGNNSGARRRVPESGPSSSASYTEEQITVIREIRRKKDFYEILGLEKTCSVEDIRKAYRKLSLKVHPDKNTAPGSEEAFKAVSKAFQCLSDEESRKNYDLVGSDEPVYEQRVRRHAHQGFNNGVYFEGDVDADEIFRNFFFGGMNRGAAMQFNGFSFGPGVGVQVGGNGSAGFNLRTLIQLLPVILFLLVNFLPSSEPVYSLSRSYPYEHRITTENGVNFFVKFSKFEQDYPSNSAPRLKLEERVENEYFSILSHNCRLEMQRLQWGFTRETPNCDMLKRFEAQI